VDLECQAGESAVVFISSEIVKSDPVSRSLRVDPILTGFDRV
jgi:hypothetical protein